LESDAQKLAVASVNSKAGSYPAIEFSASLALKSATRNLLFIEFICNYFLHDAE
jgi:hypothetical protein